MIDWSETARIPEERRMEFLRFELKLGDILVSLDRPIISTGVKVARVEEQDLPCLLLQRVARARFQADNVLPDYFCQWLQSPHFVNAIDPGRSNGVPHISHKDIERIPFTPPSLTEQHRILTKLSELQSEFGGLKRAQAETGVELNALVPSILNIAFRGEL
jgi:type I restriction enzyme S subunit